MKISIITITYNSEKTIADTIKSVLVQTYKNIEYIIIDGKSSDKTLKIINKYKKKKFKIISEKDYGIYDALNKGISLATGDIIGFLHSDDVFYDKQVLFNIAKTFENYNIDSLYGDLLYVNAQNTNKIIRYWKSKDFNKSSFKAGWMPAHPTFYVKKEIYKKYGNFNINLKISADYELMLRFLYKNTISTKYLPLILVKMRMGGTSNVNLKNRLIANQEDKKAWEMNNLNMPFYTNILKPLRKITQYFHKFLFL